MVLQKAPKLFRLIHRQICYLKMWCCEFGNKIASVLEILVNDDNYAWLLAEINVDGDCGLAWSETFMMVHKLLV